MGHRAAADGGGRTDEEIAHVEALHDGHRLDSRRAIGGEGSWLMGRVDARLGIRRAYQALYGVGLVLAAYVGGTAVGGDGARWDPQEGGLGR